jgi:AcrR family transcriptional regulator
MNVKSEVATSETATPPVPEARPLRRDAERNRQLIIGAAKVVFAQRGLDASLDEIAKEAGLGVGTVYRRFPNRDALIEALFDDTLVFIQHLVGEAVAKPRAWDGLVHFITEMLVKQGRDKGLRDAMIAREKNLAECGDKAKEEIIRDMIEPAIYGLVDRAQAEGDLRADVTATDVAVLMIAGVGIVDFTTLADPDSWRRQLSIILDGLRARPAGDNAPLTHPPLDTAAIDACMADWKYGSHATRRQRNRTN